MTVNPSTVNYELSSNTVQLIISGGSTDSEPIIDFQKNSMNIDENYNIILDNEALNSESYRVFHGKKINVPVNDA